MSTNQSIPSDPAAIEREIRQRQASLASTVDELMERAKPKNVVESAKAQARTRVDSLVGTAKNRGRGVADNAKGRLNQATSNARVRAGEATSSARSRAAAAGAAVTDRVKSGGSNTGDGVAAGAGYTVDDAAGGSATSGFAGNSQAQARQAAAKVGLINSDGEADQSRMVALAAGTTSVALFATWLAARRK